MNILVPLFLFILMSCSMQDNSNTNTSIESFSPSSKATLIYVGDPMCSWCYGIAPELIKLKDHFEGKLNFEVLVGGLRPFNTETMTDLKDFLTEHWNDVARASGQKFKYDILNRSDITYDTEPPCRAVVTVRNIAPEKAFEFFKMIQSTFYYYNRNMHLDESYLPALSSLGIDHQTFLKKFNSEEMKRATLQDFQRSNQLGIRGFPAILLQHNGKTTVITRGYAKSEELISRVNQALS